MDEIIRIFTHSPTAEIAWSVAFVALGAGAISPLVVMHKMAFFSDSVSHSVLLGVPIAIFAGMMEETWAMLAVGISVGLIVNLLRWRTTLSVDSILGVMMAGTLALAVVMYQEIATSKHLDSYLLGDIAFLPKAWFLPLMFTSLGVLAFSLFAFNRLALLAIARELVQARGLRSRIYDIAMVMVLAIVVTLGVRIMGVLMITALMVIPAASARNICRRLSTYFWTSVSISVLASLIGFVLCYHKDYAPGASIVVVLMGFFLLSLLGAKRA